MKKSAKYVVCVLFISIDMKTYDEKTQTPSIGLRQTSPEGKGAGKRGLECEVCSKTTRNKQTNQKTHNYKTPTTTTTEAATLTAKSTTTACRELVCFPACRYFG